MIHALLLWTTLLGCGGDLEKGYTDCGAVTCSPGQYCDGPGMCENGCTSDANCENGDECVIDDEFFNDGVCEPEVSDTTETDPTETDGDPLAACRAACDDFQGCGLSPSETAQCRDDCAVLSESEQRAIGNCGGQSSCGATLSCLGVDCFQDSDCGGDEFCVDYDCL